MTYIDPDQYACINESDIRYRWIKAWHIDLFRLFISSDYNFDDNRDTRQQTIRLYTCTYTTCYFGILSYVNVVNAYVSQLNGVCQGCGLGLNVSVSKLSRDVPTSLLGLVSTKVGNRDVWLPETNFRPNCAGQHIETTKPCMFSTCI